MNKTSKILFILSLIIYTCSARNRILTQNNGNNQTPSLSKPEICDTAENLFGNCWSSNEYADKCFFTVKKDHKDYYYCKFQYFEDDVMTYIKLFTKRVCEADALPIWGEKATLIEKSSLLIPLVGDYYDGDYKNIYEMIKYMRDYIEDQYTQHGTCDKACYTHVKEFELQHMNFNFNRWIEESSHQLENIKEYSLNGSFCANEGENCVCDGIINLVDEQGNKSGWHRFNSVTVVCTKDSGFSNFTPVNTKNHCMCMREDGKDINDIMRNWNQADFLEQKIKENYETFVNYKIE